MGKSIQLPDGDEIFERLRHFQAFNVQVPTMKEVIYPLSAPTGNAYSGSEH